MLKPYVLQHKAYLYRYLTNTRIYCNIAINLSTERKKYKGVMIIMKKQELVAIIAEKSGISKVAAAKALKATTDAIGDAIAKGDSVQLIGFGTFGTRKRAARAGKNPRTGETIKIAASTVAAFKAGKALKDKVYG